MTKAKHFWGGTNVMKLGRYVCVIVIRTIIVARGIEEK